MFSDIIGRGGKWVLDRIVRVLSSLKINPNILTFTGVLISFWAAWEFGYGNFFRGGCVIILAGLFDMLDGEVARVSRTATSFGAFYDSVIDRYSDIIILQGLMVYYARHQRLDYVVLVEVSAARFPDWPAARRLLHVGASRAVHQLWLTSVATPSPMVREAMGLEG